MVKSTVRKGVIRCSLLTITGIGFSMLVKPPVITRVRKHRAVTTPVINWVPLSALTW